MAKLNILLCHPFSKHLNTILGNLIQANKFFFFQSKTYVHVVVWEMFIILNLSNHNQSVKTFIEISTNSLQLLLKLLHFTVYIFLFYNVVTSSQIAITMKRRWLTKRSLLKDKITQIYNMAQGSRKR